MRQFRGDSGKFRKALEAAGFETMQDGYARTIFSDTYETTRRLKLWFAGDVHDATRRSQLRLHRELQKQFGRRFIRAGLYQAQAVFPHGPDRIRSYVVHIKR